MTKMYASPFGEGLSIKGTYLRKNDLSLSPGEGVTSSVMEGLAIYLYLREGGKKIARASRASVDIL